MKNLFHHSDYQEIVSRLENLKPSSDRKWGKMTVSQMLVHCQKPMEVAEQKLVVKRNLISFLFGKMMKKKLIVKGLAFDKNLPTAKEFVVAYNCEFEIEHQKLLKMVQDFKNNGPNAIKMEIHPFFGKMSHSEWGLLFYKHLDHHLLQFGS